VVCKKYGKMVCDALAMVLLYRDGYVEVAVIDSLNLRKRAISPLRFSNFRILEMIFIRLGSLLKIVPPR
jgi:hypothetical protein